MREREKSRTLPRCRESCKRHCVMWYKESIDIEVVILQDISHIELISPNDFY